jgi:hypothetical protein
MVSLGLNNPPRISFTPEKSRVKKAVTHHIQGDSRYKMAGAGFHSLAKLIAQMCTADSGNPRITTNIITVLRIATDSSQNLRADCHRPGLGACVACYLSAELAIRSAFESGLPMGYFCCGNPRYLSGKLNKWVNSSNRHFTATVSLFVA